MKLTTDDRKALQCAMNVLAEILQQAPPEVPDTIEEWPEDDTHLRGDFWKCSWGSVISYRGDGWYWWDHRDHCWRPENHPGGGSILTRTTDPSIPRTWDTLNAVDTDVERATGDYAGMRREFARGELSESGWFLRAKVGPFSGWVELTADRTKYVTNIREDQ